MATHLPVLVSCARTDALSFSRPFDDGLEAATGIGGGSY